MIPKIFRQSSTERIEMITEGNILKTFLFLSIPSIMMVFIQSIMPVIDGLFVYQYADPVSGAAISYCSSMQNILIMAAQGFATASSALIGQTNGSGDYKRAKSLSGQLISISVLLSLLLIPILISIGMIVTSGMEDEISGRIITYNSIYAFSLPFILYQSSFNSIKNVFGHPEITFLRMLIFMPIKLFFTFLFVGLFRLGVAGAALSALCAYILISMFVTYDLFLKKNDDSLTKSDLKIEMYVLKKYCKYSWASVIQNGTKSLGFFVMKLETARYGDIALSVQGVSGDTTNIFQSLSACFDAAIISFVSINMGANKNERAKKSAYMAIKIGLITSLIFTVLSILLAPVLINLYTDDPRIVLMAIKASRITSLGFAGFAVMFNEMPVFVGLGLNKVSLFIQTMRIWIVRLIALYALYFFIDGIGVYAVFISSMIANLVGGVISHVLFMRVNWKKKI